MERHQKHSNAFSTLFLAPTVRVPPILGGIPSRFNTFLAHFGKGARRIRYIFPRLSSLPFREKSSPNWGSEVRGLGGPKDFVVVVKRLWTWSRTCRILVLTNAIFRFLLTTWDG